MAYGLPIEGDDGPFAGQVVEEATTVGPSEPAGEVAARLREVGADTALVVNDERVVLGRVEVAELDGLDPGSPVRHAMHVSPSTVRPSVLASSLTEGDDPEVVVTTPDGRLLGVVRPHAGKHGAGERSEHSDDRHGDHGHGDDPGMEGLEGIEGIFHETALAAQERFGDREPSEDELLAFLRERLVGEGSTPEQADALLARMKEEPPAG